MKLNSILIVKYSQANSLLYYINDILHLSLLNYFKGVYQIMILYPGLDSNIIFQTFILIKIYK